MTAPQLMPDCPTEETLAAFVDNRLTPEQSRVVIAHLATCGECREIVLMATDLQTSNVLVDERVAAENVVPIRFRQQRWFAAAGVAAAAVIVALVTVQPFGRGGGTALDLILDLLLRAEPYRIYSLKQVIETHLDMAKLVKASASLQVRPTAARFAEDFPYKPAKRTMRGEDDEGSDLGLNAGIYAAAADSEHPHVRGVAYLLSGDKQLIPEAIPLLEVAYEGAKDHERDAVALDLAAALLRHGQDEDLKRALELSEGVWKRKHLPVAAWNRAVALGLLERKDQAKRAWQDYLDLDSTSEWAEEARERMARLDETF